MQNQRRLSVSTTGSPTRDREEFKNLVRGVFGLTSSSTDNSAIDYQIRMITTDKLKDRFMSFAESELMGMVNEEEKSRYQKYNRLEKLNIVASKFNKMLRIELKELESQNPKDSNLISSSLSVEERFAENLKKKLAAVIRNMRAIRDASAAKRELSKMVNKKEMLEIGIDELSYKYIIECLDCEDKEEAGRLVKLYELGELEDLVSNIFNSKIEMLNRRVSKIEGKASEESICTIKNQAFNMEKSKENTIGLLPDIYLLVKENMSKDWGNSHNWGAFKVVSGDKKEPLFSEKEIEAMERMGGWNNMIKIFDQDRLLSSVKKVFREAKLKKDVSQSEKVRDSLPEAKRV